MAERTLMDGALQKPASAPQRQIPQHEVAADKRDFFADVIAVVRQVPKGRVTSYGAIAKYLGAVRSSRMVGYCMNNSHTAKPLVPAHRVVNRAGMLTGKHHFATATRMEELLKKEGVKVKHDQVVDFQQKFWDPAVELGW